MSIPQAKDIKFHDENVKTVYKEIMDRLFAYEQKQEKLEAKSDHTNLAISLARMEELDWIASRMLAHLEIDPHFR
jgi:hypothetical protein